MYQRILVPTDGSDISAEAADAAIAFARACGSELVALSIAQPEPLLPSAEGAMATTVLDPELMLAGAQRHAGRVADAAAKAGVPCTIVTGFGHSPAGEIIEAVARTHCDLVFMGSHGRRGLSRLIAGSVTQHVLAGSPVPVMVYRPRPAAAVLPEQPAAPDPGALRP